MPKLIKRRSSYLPHHQGKKTQFVVRKKVYIAKIGTSFILFSVNIFFLADYESGIEFPVGVNLLSW